MADEDEDEYFNQNFNLVREQLFEEILSYAVNTYTYIPETNGRSLMLMDNIHEILNNIRNNDNIFQNDLERALTESFNESQDSLKRSDNDVVVEFNSIKYENLENNTSYDVKCMICLEEFESDLEVVLTDCTHIFHLDCLKEWIRYKKECAVCRNEIKIK